MENKPVHYMMYTILVPMTLLLVGLLCFLGYVRYSLHSSVTEIEKEFQDGRDTFMSLAGDKLNFEGDFFLFPDGSRYQFTYIKSSLDRITTPTMYIHNNYPEGAYDIRVLYHQGVLTVDTKGKENAKLLVDNLNKYLLVKQEEKVLDVKRLPLMGH